jgi:hypothetical protein
MLYALISFLFSITAYAGINIRLNDPLIYDLIPKNGKLTCFIQPQKNFGYILQREETNEIKIYVINNGVNEGEKTAFLAKIEREGLTQIYIKHHQRDEKFGRYIEFLIARQRSAESKDGFTGSVAFTDSLYSKDASGKEQEDLIPVARSPIRCGY